MKYAEDIPSHRDIFTALADRCEKIRLAAAAVDAEALHAVNALHGAMLDFDPSKQDSAYQRVINALIEPLLISMQNNAAEMWNRGAAASQKQEGDKN
jgi:hypothetical protein